MPSKRVAHGNQVSFTDDGLLTLDSRLYPSLRRFRENDAELIRRMENELLRTEKCEEVIGLISAACAVRKITVFPE